MTIPARPKIYHIVHVDKLPSIIADGNLWCDAEMNRRDAVGTVIGMADIKQRRLTLPVKCRKGLHVGDCVPFYFCPRSVMLYLLYRGNHENLSYQGGQEPIVHLEADLYQTVQWAEQTGLRWAFTLSNAGSRYFEDRCDLNQLDEIDWRAVETRDWQQCREGKQAEFLLESRFPWELIERIGVMNSANYHSVKLHLLYARHKPRLAILPNWYYG